MSLNEARAFRGRPRSSLTKEQKAEAHAAIFGLPSEAQRDTFRLESMANSRTGLSYEEVEKMRAIVSDHDGANKKTREFDLNNPPKVPHVHRPYPTTVYKHATGKHKIVQNESELAAALESGYERKPAPLPRDEQDDAPKAEATLAPAAGRKAKA
jgi:hypothetical protein